MATTEHEKARAEIRGQLRCLWADRSIWEDAEFVNYTAFDAVMCINHLIQLGVSNAEFEHDARKLSQHACRCIREKCTKIFARFYP